MATTKKNSIILVAARRLKDARTSAGSSSDTGAVYTSAILSDYCDRAVREFLKEKLLTLGKEEFARQFPEYIKTSTTLTLAAGSVAKPSDCWFVLDLHKTDLSVKFEPLEPDEVGSVLTSDAGLDNASATHPKFYEEGSNIKTLGVTTGDVYARYIRTQPDITILTAAAGNGTIYTTSANLIWTAATNLLTIAAISILDSDDINRLIMFRTATIVYVGRITAVSETGGTTTLVTITGDGLPAGNLTAPNIVEFVVSDLWPEDTDLDLNDNHFGEIIDQMVQFAEEDAIRIVRASSMPQS